LGGINEKNKTMEIEIYKIDAFCKDLFSGNPAAVCPLKRWLEDDAMQNIAFENNLAETAFYVKENDHYEIRWFTPTVEVDLCGHATLAAAHVLFHHKAYDGDTIIFNSPRSGELKVRKESRLLTLDFPADDLIPLQVRCEMTEWFDAKPLEAFRGKTDYLLVFPAEIDIRNIKVNLSVIQTLKEVRGVIVTAKGNEVDFVSRFFAPQSGIPEDPVTGSAHTSLAPYWSKKLGKKKLSALQLSARRGFLDCEVNGERIQISGKAKTFLKGTIHLS
jgi:PhzF family phenazine biosynthesis protein